MEQPPYIKECDQIGDFAVWIVDGNYIRGAIDEQFTNFGHHREFNYIPKNEFWIDKESAEGETKFFTEHLYIENQLMASGIERKKARDIANGIELEERKKDHSVQKNFKKLEEGKYQEVLEKIHKKKLKSYSEKIDVWIVDGALARSLFFMNFTAGGHSAVYDFIPENEVWIDDDISPKERKFILIHELYERYLMKIKGWKSYDKAHAKASLLEYFCRKHSKSTDLFLKECLKLNQKFKEYEKI
ncbi:MAG: hypothetical protein V1698_01305 [bacterium]